MWGGLVSKDWVWGGLVSSRTGCGEVWYPLGQGVGRFGIQGQGVGRFGFL